MAIHSHAPPPPIRCSVPTEKGVAFAPPRPGSPSRDQSMHWCKRLHYDAEMLAATRLQHTEILIFPLVYCRHLKKKPLASTADITNHWGCQQKFIAKIHRKILRASAWEREDALQASPRSG